MKRLPPVTTKQTSVVFWLFTRAVSVISVMCSWERQIAVFTKNKLCETFRNNPKHSEILWIVWFFVYFLHGFGLETRLYGIQFHKMTWVAWSISKKYVIKWLIGVTFRSFWNVSETPPKIIFCENGQQHKCFSGKVEYLRRVFSVPETFLGEELHSNSVDSSYKTDICVGKPCYVCVEG